MAKRLMDLCVSAAVRNLYRYEGLSETVLPWDPYMQKIISEAKSHMSKDYHFVLPAETVRMLLAQYRLRFNRATEWTTINLINYPMRDSLLETLVMKLDFVTHIALRQCQLRDDHLLHLKRLSSCVSMDLRQNEKLTSYGVEHLTRRSKLHRLQALYVSVGIVGDGQDRMLKRFSTLDSLKLVYFELYVFTEPKTDMYANVLVDGWIEESVEPKPRMPPSFLPLHRILLSPAHQHSSEHLYSRQYETDQEDSGSCRGAPRFWKNLTYRRTQPPKSPQNAQRGYRIMSLREI